MKYLATYVTTGYLEIEAESEEEALAEAKTRQYDVDSDELEFDELGGMTWYFNALKAVDNE